MPDQDVNIEPGAKGRLRYDKERRAIVGSKPIIESGIERGVASRQPEADQMAVLVANSTPYVIWSAAGGLVGACRTKEHALGLMQELKASFPHKDYVCRDVDGDLISDTRTTSHHDGQVPNDAPATGPNEA